MDIVDPVDEFIKHFGVKGMRWGVQKARASELRVGSTTKDLKDARMDDRWFKKTHGANLNIGRIHGKTTQAIIKEAEKNMKPEIKALNKKPEFSSRAAKKAIKKAKFNLNPDDPIAKKYHKEASDIYMKHVRVAAPKHLQTSPSGKWEDEFVTTNNGWYVGFKRTGSAKHSSISNPDLAFVIRPIKDEDGYIVDFELVKDVLVQSNLGADFIKHFGVKGMKWGVRRKATVGPQEVIISDKRKIPGLAPRIKVSGGSGHTIHPDAISARTIGQIGKKSGLHAVSDNDLRKYSNRLQLEANVKRLNFNESNVGKRFVLRLLGQAGEREASSVTKSGARAVRKGATRTGRRALVKAGLIAAAA